MLPDATHYQHDPARLRALVEASGLSQVDIAARLGVSPRQVRYYLAAGESGQAAPYVFLYALETLAHGRASSRDRRSRS